MLFSDCYVINLMVGISIIDIVYNVTKRVSVFCLKFMDMNEELLVQEPLCNI